MSDVALPPTGGGAVSQVRKVANGRVPEPSPSAALGRGHETSGLLLHCPALAARQTSRIKTLMTETRIWPRVARGVATLVAAALLIACQRSAPSQTVPAASAAPPPSPPPVSVDLVQVASSALQDCPEPTAPTVPDGSKASSAQMMAAHAAFQTYDAATNNYTKCVDAAVDRISAQYKGTASDTDIQSLQAFGSRAHNTAIDQEQAVADQFNTQLRAFKGKHPRA